MIILSLIFLSLFTNISLGADTLSPNQSLWDNGHTLVSQHHKFELGFFSPPSSASRYLGIWFKNISRLTPVWVANGNNPIPDSTGILSLTPAGNLVIYNNQTKSAVWSSNSSAANSVLQLLDSGNLVVKHIDSGDYAWQSFDYPGDTLIPGMKLGWDLIKNKEWYITSWKSLDDPSTGEFSYRLNHRGLPQIVLYRGLDIQYRSGPWDGVRFGNGSPFKPNSIFNPIFVFNSSHVYYTFENSDSTVVSRFVVNQTGLIQHVAWSEKREEWVDIVTLQGDTCDSYEMCGPNGVCIFDAAADCRCLGGFKPKSLQDWNKRDWTDGCKLSLQCDVVGGVGVGEDDGFMKFSGMKLPDNSTFLRNGTGLSREECEVACLKDCNCVAFAVTLVNTCVVWFGVLLDVRQYNGEGGQDLYVRVVKSELGFKSKKKNIAGITSGAVISVLLVAGLIGWFVVRKGRRRQKKRAWALDRSTHESESNPHDDDVEEMELPLFELSSVTIATNNFAYTNKIGEGGFGPVYKGKLPNGQEIAVKRLSATSGQGIKEFKNEVILISKLQHRNLVRLLGCCIPLVKKCVHREERMLVYEYMPNGSLNSFIFSQTKGKSLEWRRRFDIIVGVARGLLYLHRDSRLRIIHRDLKASNILLDIDMNPRISDFGIAREFGGDQSEENTKTIIGTYGYMSPEYAIKGSFSIKSDVFSFGVLVLEIVSGKRNRGFYHADHDLDLLGHVCIHFLIDETSFHSSKFAWKLWNEEDAMKLVADSIQSSPVSESEVLRCIQVALLCVQHRAEDRPTMASVLSMFESENLAPTQPKQPGFYGETFTANTDPCIVDNNEMTLTTLHGR
ncbi:G-type lectin S-receptor-like serine/threonine-protein kinase At4g27290 [Impatiens glandulifera]|uniref:G-type lectin S-receptor-like serine/threonine-protein kinase At4g27290 n=1 Tax=Impatiens glandulifera TaxID=253017 RepID=UPI001FB1432B|nr:G-type lectin S-receptor-like serine/threonine-protein kinase At4g27290 [Impatiens glandulifera]